MVNGEGCRVVLQVAHVAVEGGKNDDGDVALSIVQGVDTAFGGGGGKFVDVEADRGLVADTGGGVEGGA